MRAASVAFSSAAVGEEVLRRARATNSSSPLTPQRDGEARASGRGSPAESFGRRAAIAFSAGVVELGGLSFGQPLASRRRPRRATCGSASRSRASDRADRVRAAAAGVVLGDAGHDRKRSSRRRSRDPLRARSPRGSRRACRGRGDGRPASSSPRGRPGRLRLASMRVDAGCSGPSSRSRPSARRPAGARREPDLRVRVVEQAGRASVGRAAARRAATRTALRRTPADGCFRAAATVDAPSCLELAASRPRPVQRPQRVDRRRRSGRSRRPTCPRSASTRSDATSSLPRSTSSRWACSRQNMLSFLSASTSSSGVVLRQRRTARDGFAVLGDDAVDAAVRLVAQGGLVGGPLAGLEPCGRRVVLDDEVVPVDHPHVPVRADLGHDRRGPLVVAGHEVPGVVRAEVACRRGLS